MYKDDLFIPHSKHSKTGCLMLCDEITTVYCERHTKHSNALYGQNVELYYSAGARRPGQTRQPIYIVTVETSRPVQVKHTSIRRYSGNLATRAGKAHPFTLLPWKPLGASRQGTFIYVVTVET
jgi:hypothetical protein